MQKFFSAMVSSVKIGTHNGTFHCDEALACYMIKKLSEYKNAEIVRSRDPTILETCDIVVDVGGEYDPSRHRYDHHQKSFEESMGSVRPNINSKVKLSSAGLIYHHFGERILEATIGRTLEKDQANEMFQYVYRHFIQEIDAVDNGIPMYETGEPLYTFKTDLSSRVAQLHPPWNAKNTNCTDELFEKAMQLTGKEFDQRVLEFSDVWWPARVVVQNSVDKRFQVHSSGEIIEFDFCPWKAHLFEVEKAQSIEGAIKYAIFCDSGSNWRVAAVPLTPGNFVLRVPLHEAWRGIREEPLQEISGVKDAVFVHANGFIGGARSREGALALAVKTLEQRNLK